jgi:hypothetical protein
MQVRGDSLSGMYTRESRRETCMHATSACSSRGERRVCAGERGCPPARPHRSPTPQSRGPAGAWTSRAGRTSTSTSTRSPCRTPTAPRPSGAGPWASRSSGSPSTRPSLPGARARPATAPSRWMCARDTWAQMGPTARTTGPCARGGTPGTRPIVGRGAGARASPTPRASPRWVGGWG